MADLVVPSYIEEEYDHLVINGNRYFFKCDLVMSQQSRFSKHPSFIVTLLVYSEKEKAFLDHKDAKSEYFFEKIQQYIKNTINGQRHVTFDTTKPRNFS